MRNIAVIGLGSFGSSVSRELTRRGIEVLAIDRDQDQVENIKESVTHAVALDATDENALTSISIENVDVAVVCIGKDIEANLLTTILLRKLGVNHIWTRAISPLQQEILRALDVEKIINLESEMGRFVASSLMSANISRFIPLTEGHAIVEVKIPEILIGKSLREIDPRRKFQINVVAIKKSVPKITPQGERMLEEDLEDVPDPDRILEETDSLLVVGSEKSIEHFAAMG